jgi:hypothetical protein
MDTPDSYYFTFLDNQDHPIRLQTRFVLTRTSPFDGLFNVLSMILENTSEYNIDTDYITVQVHVAVGDNIPLENQMNGEMNCACKVVLDELKKVKESKKSKWMIKNVMKINDKYLESGINNEGLQELSNKTYMTLIVKDKIGEDEFKPSGNKRVKKVLLLSHDNHISEELYDSDDEQEDFLPQCMSAINIDSDEWVPPSLRNEQSIEWFDDNQQVINRANEYELENDEGLTIISKGELQSYITPETIYKTKFYQWEDYEQCFTSGGVGKAKFIEQHPEYKYGINESDPFYDLLMDADRSGFYCRTAESNKEHFKYDQNKSYKSFNKSGLFNGFPIIEAVFKVDKPFSELYEKDEEIDFGCDCDGSCMFCINDKSRDWSYLDNQWIAPIPSDLIEEYNKQAKEEVEKHPRVYQNYPDVPLRENNFKHGLVYIETDTLTVDDLDKKIYYEASGWYPIEIVKAYYEKYNINPVIKSYAYATEIFDVDFRKFTNDQFRTFLGKCISQSFDEVWRTKDYNEFMRARYILRNRIVKISKEESQYEIYYESDKKPWNMPVISAYIKLHQKYTLFEQYNKLIDNNITPIAVNIDGIETEQNCDHLFNIGKRNGQWKHENIKVLGTESSVIERDIPEPRGELYFDKKYIIDKYTHISGMAGNGKTHFITELSKAYLKMCVMAPTNEAVKNLTDKGLGLDAEIHSREINIRIS